MILQNFQNGYNVSNGSLLAKGEKNDCIVRAIANAFNVCYDTAHGFAADVLKRKARRGTTNTYVNLVGAKKVTFDLFSNTLFPETKTFKLSGKEAPINPKYTHKKVKYTVLVKVCHEKILKNGESYIVSFKSLKYVLSICLRFCSIKSAG